MTRFVLLSTQRSGSTWVIDMLNSHPQTIAYSELLLENGRGNPTWGGALDVPFWDTYSAENGGGYTRDLFFRYLDDLYAPRDGVDAIGFKVMYGQAGAYPDLYDYLISNDVRVIHLIRGNLLDIVISKDAAVSRDLFHARIGDPVRTAKIRLNTTNLLDRLAWQAREVRKATEKFSGLQYLEVFYEDLASASAEFGRLLRFLAIHPRTAEMTSSLRRIITADHTEIIENYACVKRTLEGTRFSSMLR